MWSRAVLAAAFWLVVPSIPTSASQDCGTPYDCAVTQVQRQDFAGAIQSLEPLLRQVPRELKVLNLLGLALTGDGRVEDGNRRFREALAIDGTFYPARKNLAINEFNSGRLVQAEQHFGEVLLRAPGDEITHVHLAEIHRERRDWRTALSHYEKGRSRLAQNPIWQLHYASCLLATSEKAKAIAALDALPPDAGASLFEAGVMLGRASAHAEAARFFDRARAGYKDPYAAGYNRTLMLVEAGDHAGAIRSAEALFAEGFEAAELYNLVARAHVQAERIQEAYEALRQATRLEPTTEAHYTDLVMICLDHENFDLGIEIVDVGLHYLPGSGTLHLERGVLLIMKGLFAQAEEAFDAAQQRSPGSAIPSIALAMAWMQTGSNPKAVDLLRRRADLHPNDAIVFHTLGLALMRSGADPADAVGDEAVQSFSRAVTLDPGLGSARAELGKLLLKRGDVRRAVEQLEQAVAIEPSSTSPAYALAQAYRRLGDTARAQELLGRVSKLNAQERGDDPDHELKRNVMRIVRASGAAGPKPESPQSDVTWPQGRRQLEPALAAFREAARLDRLGRAGEAIGSYAHALRLDPRKVEARYGLALACGKGPVSEAATRLLRQVIAAAPRLAEAHYNLGLHLWTTFKAGSHERPADLDEALAALERAVELDAMDPRFHSALGQVLAEKEHLPRAVEHLGRAAALAPQVAEHAYNLGLALRLTGDLDAAAGQFRTAIRLDARHGLAERSLGLVLREQGNLPASADALRRAIALQPETAMGHHVLGTVLQKLDEVPAAIDAYRQAIHLDPLLTEAHVNLAQLLAKAGRKDEALDERAEVLRLNAVRADFGRALLVLDRAATALAAQRPSEAIALLREAVGLSPDFALGHYRLGVALMEIKDDKGARAAFDRALQIEPTDAHAHYQLGRLLRRRGDTAGAMRELAAAAALAPCFVDAQRDLADLAVASREWPAAVRALELVLAVEPDDTRTRDLLARAPSTP